MSFSNERSNSSAFALLRKWCFWYCCGFGQTKISSVSVFMRSWWLVFWSNPFFLKLEASIPLCVVDTSRSISLPATHDLANVLGLCTLHGFLHLWIAVSGHRDTHTINNGHVYHAIKDCSCGRTSTVFWTVLIVGICLCVATDTSTP